MKNSTINVDELKKVLPYGAITEIAKRSKVSRDTVYSVLNGRSFNLTVLSNIKKYVQEIGSIIPEINTHVEEINNMVSINQPA